MPDESKPNENKDKTSSSANKFENQPHENDVTTDAEIIRETISSVVEQTVNSGISNEEVSNFVTFLNSPEENDKKGSASDSLDNKNIVYDLPDDSFKTTSNSNETEENDTSSRRSKTVIENTNNDIPGSLVPTNTEKTEIQPPNSDCIIQIEEDLTVSSYVEISQEVEESKESDTDLKFNSLRSSNESEKSNQESEPIFVEERNGKKRKLIKSSSKSPSSEESFGQSSNSESFFADVEDNTESSNLTSPTVENSNLSLVSTSIDDRNASNNTLPLAANEAMLLEEDAKTLDLAEPSTAAEITEYFTPTLSSGSNNLKARSEVARNKKRRCLKCNKKLDLTAITCRCGGLFCAKHRYTVEHNCTFDYKAMGADKIRKENPKIVAEKVKKL